MCALVLLYFIQYVFLLFLSIVLFLQFWWCFVTHLTGDILNPCGVIYSVSLISNKNLLIFSGGTVRPDEFSRIVSYISRLFSVC